MILKYLLIVFASLAGTVLIMYLLVLYSVNVRNIWFLQIPQLKNALYSLRFLVTHTPWVAWLLIALVSFVLLFMALSLPIILRIERVSDAVRRIAEGGYEVRLKPKGMDELSSLEADVNAMAGQIEAAFEAERAAERSKDEFVINIAHDLRTPLTSVLGYLTLMNERQLDVSEAAEYTRIAFSKARQLKTQVDELFELLRLTPEAMKPELSRFSAKQFLLQVQDEAYPLLTDAGMEMRLVDVRDDLLIWADGTLLSRVFDNLILNAVRYAREGRHIDLSAQRCKGGALLCLTTHANPIPETELSRVFERLHRVEASRSEQTGGAGLGLAICKGVMELHGGRIRARATQDGTRFEMVLPDQNSPGFEEKHR